MRLYFAMMEGILKGQAILVYSVLITLVVDKNSFVFRRLWSQSYQVMTCPSPLPEMDLLPQYRPDTPPMSLKPSRYGILAPSSATKSDNHHWIVSSGDISPTRRFRRLPTNHLSHVSRYPTGTARIDGDIWVLAS